MKTEFLTYPGVYYNPGTGSWISCWLQNGLPGVIASKDGTELYPLTEFDTENEWEII